MKTLRRLAPVAAISTLLLASGTPALARAQAEPAPSGSTAQEGAEISFVKDVAPILVGNCVGCHNPKDKARRANFDLTTFTGLMAGGDSGPGITGGKPAMSSLLLRVKGEETPKMPPGQRNLSAQAIAKIEAWINAGARLDPGVAPAAELAKIAPTPEQLRQAELAKLSPEALDEKLVEKGRERWKRATAEEPQITSGKRFLILSQLPEDRAQALLKNLETGLTAALGVLGPEGEKAAPGAEKISVYVFSERNPYVEFVRSVENGDPEAEQLSHANLGVEAPYLAAVDPLAGGPEPKPEPRTSRKRATRDDQSAAPLSTPDRTLAGLLLEPLGTAMIGRTEGSPPRWLSLGFGTFLAANAEPRSPYYQTLRQTVAGVYQRGWMSPIVELLGNQGTSQEIRAAGFSLLEWLYSTNRPSFTPFVREMLKDAKKLDQVLERGFGASRDQFLQSWGTWVGARYKGTR